MSSITYLIKHYGFVGFCLYASAKLLSYLHVNVSFDSLYFIDLKELESHPLSPKFRVLTFHDIQTLHRYEGDEGSVTYQNVTQRMNQLEYALSKIDNLQESFEPFGFFVDDVPVASGIIRYRYYGAGRFQKLPAFSSGQCYAYNIWTLPDFQRNGYALQLYLNLAQYVKNKGLSELQIFVSTYNRAGRACAQKAGFVRKCRYRMWRVGRHGKLHFKLCGSHYHSPAMQ